MKKIELTQGQFALVDDEDFEKVSRYKWFAAYDSKMKSFYARRCKNRKNIHMHREIMNPSKKMVVDHINHNTLDNRRENLRICTSVQNHRNVKVRFDNNSGYKGVIFHKRDKKWSAVIRYAGKQKWLGYFENKIDAVNARLAATIKFHKEFSFYEI